MGTSFPENISGVLFQLSVQPFPAGVKNDPIGLIYTRVVTGAVIDESSLGGKFDVNFKSLKEMATVKDPTERSALKKAFDPSQIVSPAGETGKSTVTLWQQNTFENFNADAFDPNSMPYQAAENCFDCDTQERKVIKTSNLTPVYYARIIPLAGNLRLSAPSNQVMITFNPPSTIPVEKQNPPIYDVQITSVTAPIPPSSHWGCVDILAINPNSWVWSSDIWFHGKLGQFQSMMANHQPYCPAPYQPKEKHWYEALWDAVNDVLKFMDKIYQKCKEISVDTMLAQADLAHFKDLCSTCYDLTKKVLAKGQEEVLMYEFGAPAEVPSLDQLTDDGIDLVVEKSFEYMGIKPEDCDASWIKEGLTCKKIVTDALKKIKQEFADERVASYQNQAVAQQNGYFSLIMPIDKTALTVAPSKTNAWQTATAKILVTRKPNDTAQSEEQLKTLDYELEVQVDAVNPTCVNKVYTLCTNNATVNGAPDNCSTQQVTLVKPCEGTVFKSGAARIELLAPGESREYTTLLSPQPYFNPEVPAALRDQNKGGDFPLLYMGGQAEARAKVTTFGFLIPDSTSEPFAFPLPDLNNPAALLGGW